MIKIAITAVAYDAIRLTLPQWPLPRRAASACPRSRLSVRVPMARLLSCPLNRVPLDLKEARLSGGARSGKPREERFAGLHLLANRG